MTRDELRREIAGYVSGKRLAHTYAVERESEALAHIFSLDADMTEKLCCAALLHDLTKQKTAEEQLELCRRFGIAYTPCDLAAPKVFHAMTGAALARELFPEVADETVCACIRYHTVGRPDMTLPEKLLFLAAYIEDTRTFADCVELRRLFYDGLPQSLPERLIHLDRIMVTAYDMTVRCLLEENAVISPDTVAARNALLLDRIHQQNQQK